MKNSKWSQKGLKFQYVALNVACWMEKKVLSWNKLRKMKCLCNRWVLVRKPDTSKEIVHFVHEVHPVFAVTLCTFLHMLCEIMMPCQLSTFSEFIWNAFQFQGHLAKKQICKSMKNSKWRHKGLKLDDVTLNGTQWPQKKSGVQIIPKKWKNHWKQ